MKPPTLKSRQVRQLKFFTRCFKAQYRNGATKLIAVIKERGLLRVVMQDTGKIARTEQAHHLIPIEALKQCPLAQKAVLGGFQINGKINGLALSIRRHKKVHDSFDSYNRFVIGELLSLESRLGSAVSQATAKKEVEKLARLMRRHFE